MGLMANTFRTLFRASPDDEGSSDGDTASTSMTGDGASFDSAFLTVEERAEESFLLMEESESKSKCDSEVPKTISIMESMSFNHLDDGDSKFQPKENSIMEGMAVAYLDEGDSAFQPRQSSQPLVLPMMSSGNAEPNEPNAPYNKVPATELHESSRPRVQVAASLAETQDSERDLAPTHLPVSLHFLGDEEVLSPYECLLRKNIEFFGADPSDDRTSLGQVGIRCRNCAHLHRNDRDSMEFPRRYEDLGASSKRLACHMIQSCDFVSTTLKAELTRLSKLPISFDSKYWAEAAQESGVLTGLRWDEWSPRVRAPSFGRRQLHKEYYNYQVGGLSNRKRSLTYPCTNHF
jgi:hypothetical protein